jgi:hypothetical protein
MPNRPEIKAYPMEFYPNPHGETSMGHPIAPNNRRQERNSRNSDEDRYLRGLVGKSVTVYCAGTGQLHGVLLAVLSDAIIIRTERGQLLIHDWAIAAIQSEQT